MKITDYSMALNSYSTHQTKETEQTNLRTWTDKPDAQNVNGNSNGVFLNLSSAGIKLSHQDIESNEISACSATQETDDRMTEEAKSKLTLISDFVYLVSGKRIKFVIPKLPGSKENSSGALKDTSTPAPAIPSQSPQRVGWGIDFSYQRTYSEESHVSFSANGIVKTADGKEIQLELNLNMSRSFYSETNISFKAGDALIDPLVINLGSTPAWLSDKKISFDINVDGKNENINVPDSSSGFLVLDKNHNGVIDDGSELFGPQSGNGFEDLAQYDNDNNGWIDENDPIYDNLKIWQHDDSGNSSLIAIGKAGVGAIYLGSAETDFKYADNDNNTQGVLRQTGIYLRENGSVGTVQHIDLSI